MQSIRIINTIIPNKKIPNIMKPVIDNIIISKKQYQLSRNPPQKISETYIFFKI